jgi:lactate/malate dehydrogenase, NAD binding domain
MDGSSVDGTIDASNRLAPRIPRVAIIGAGLVAATTAYALLMSGVAGEIALIGRDRDRVEGHLKDLSDAALYSRPTRIVPGDYTYYATAHVIIVAVGRATMNSTGPDVSGRATNQPPTASPQRRPASVAAVIRAGVTATFSHASCIRPLVAGRIAGLFAPRSANDRGRDETSDSCDSDRRNPPQWRSRTAAARIRATVGRHARRETAPPPLEVPRRSSFDRQARSRRDSFPPRAPAQRCVDRDLPVDGWSRC